MKRVPQVDLNNKVEYIVLRTLASYVKTRIKYTCMYVHSGAETFIVTRKKKKKQKAVNQNNVLNNTLYCLEHYIFRIIHTPSSGKILM